MCWKIQTWSCKISFSSWFIAWQAALQKTKVRLNVLTDIDILLTVEKGIRGRICHPIYWYAKANKNTWINMIKTKNHHIFNIVM